MKGHQDSNEKARHILNKHTQSESKRNQTTKLAWEARLNIRADELATWAKGEIAVEDQQQQVDRFPACGAHIKIRGKLITQRFKEEIREVWNEIPLRKEYVKLFKWKQSTYDIIDWEAAGRLLNNKDYEPHRFVVRYINMRFPLRGEKYTASENNTCPCCRAEKEDAKHVL
eukprot:1396190-Ditylum_brightwellii.AAC.1